MAQKNLIGENGGERKINPSANPANLTLSSDVDQDTESSVLFPAKEAERRFWLNTEDILFKMAMKTPSMLSLRSKIREDHLTCTICFNNFTHPKALPCLHTFCEGCIRDFVMGRGFDVQGQFPCPVCRLEIPIPSGGIAAFPVGYIM